MERELNTLPLSTRAHSIVINRESGFIIIFVRIRWPVIIIKCTLQRGVLVKQG